MRTELLELVVWLAGTYHLRYTPLHHRAYPVVYRLSALHRKGTLREIKDALSRHGIGATDPLRKLDGAWYIEVF